ncbi:hypothetical protein [Variovorax paradoxus]|uniref:hypothetical protein n=1 Tax=Variovorax paradoxus TaxID=34073 RepID=UPI002864C690|nr:hypothetical protein [Variovorax paradoxus]MDR6453912.1 hypothetical protein [Variovorax paradoxus]
MTVHILGIDPGASTGLACYEDGVLTWLRTIEPHSIEHFLRHHAPARVVFEDSRLESKVWTTAGSRAAALKIARNVGQIDAWCSLITSICADLGIPAHGISPTAKGAKLDAAAFALVTRWAERSNQHERDAAMVAWPYRRTAR